MYAAGSFEVDRTFSKFDFAVKFNIEVTKMGLSDCLEQELLELLLSLFPVSIPEQFPSTFVFNIIFKNCNHNIRASQGFDRGLAAGEAIRGSVR